MKIKIIPNGYLTVQNEIVQNSLTDVSSKQKLIIKGYIFEVERCE